MKRTLRLTAYDECMEILLLLFVLSSIEQDPSLKRSLASFLSFYKENRELVASLVSAKQAVQTAPPAESAPPAASAQTAPTEPSAETKSRPREEVGIKSILEEYLARASL